MKEHLPPLPWRGSCQCGQVRYSLTRYPLTFYCCHCTECQKQAASMHGESLLVERAALEIEGKTKTWARDTDSGNRTTCHFCPDCGTRIFHQGTHREGGGEEGPAKMVSLKGGTLEVIGQLRPVGHIWMRSAQAGFRADPEAMLYDLQPESYDELCRRFAERHGLSGT